MQNAKILCGSIDKIHTVVDRDKITINTPQFTDYNHSIHYNQSELSQSMNMKL